MKRIAIIGTTGSGKSTLARQLAVQLTLRHTELDNLHWLPGWQERDEASFRALVDSATSGSRWVIDGGYSEVRDLVWGRADTIVWLNYGFAFTAARLLRRTYLRVFQGDPCCNGNRETLRLALGHDSILLWLLKTYWRNRRIFPVAIASFPNAKALVLYSPSETAEWLENLGKRTTERA